MKKEVTQFVASAITKGALRDKLKAKMRSRHLEEFKVVSLHRGSLENDLIQLKFRNSNFTNRSIIDEVSYTLHKDYSYPALTIIIHVKILNFRN